MLLDRQSSLAESTLQELLCRNLDGAEYMRPKTVLVLLFYHMNGMDEGLRGIKELIERSGRHIRIRICPDELIFDHCNVVDLASKSGVDDWISLEEAEKMKETVTSIHIPVLPFSIVSDLVRFNDASQPIRLLLWALMRGKKVSAFTAGADPFHPIWGKAGLNNGTSLLKYEMKKQLQQLGGLGVQLFNSNAQLHTYFKHAVMHEEKRIVTAETIKDYAEAGKRKIEIGKGTIMTPLARDMAKEYQIEINEKRAGEIYGNGNRSRKSHSNKKR